jgi:glyoxylase-like metal-dependent hydrolase (beta-lactamase superfamily II)
MLHYLTIPVTAFQQNCSLLWCDQTHEAALIDPGGDIDTLLAQLQAQQLTLTALWLTHAHIDHAGGTAALAQQANVPIIGPHRGDQFWIDGLPQQSLMFGFPPAGTFVPTRWLEDGDTVQVGRETLHVRHTPGHTPGHVALYEPESKSLFTGDTLFRESIGRTDLPGGDYSWIMRSILDSLIPLGEEVHIYPGHGPESTIGHETLYNPFIVEVLNEEVNYLN